MKGCLKMKRKRQLLIIIAVVLSLIIICFFTFFVATGLFIKPNNEEITFLSAHNSTVAAVTDIGNVYVKGDVSHELRYGVDRFRQFLIRNSDTFVKIYDKNDAITVNLSEDGGCIITKQSDVYVFINSSEKYQTPTYLCSGYNKAYLADDNIYLLNSNGEYGFISIEKPDIFNLLCKDVVDFDIEYSNSELYPYGISFVLTKNNHLYVSDLKKAINDTEAYIEDVAGFNSIAFCADYLNDNKMKKYIEISIVNRKGEAFWYEGDLDENYDRIVDQTNYVKVGNDVSIVASYPRGCAMLDDKHQVSLYGYDFGHEDFISGQILFYDVMNIFSSSSNLILLYQNGDIDYFGFNASTGSTRYFT